MELTTFLTTLKGTRGVSKETAFLSFKCTTNSEHTLWKLHSSDVCPCCKQEVSNSLYVGFKRPVKLTIFQVGLLWSLYVLNKRPHDYAQYHKCVAGKEFITNIESIKRV
jgi:hypothetical protein